MSQPPRRFLPTLSGLARRARESVGVFGCIVVGLASGAGCAGCAADAASSLLVDGPPATSPGEHPTPPVSATRLAQEGMAATLALTPRDTTIALGDTLRVGAEALDSAGATLEAHAAIWRVAGDSVLTLADAGGLVRATGAGDAYVVVVIDGIADSTRVRVAPGDATPGQSAAAAPVRPTLPRLLDLDRVRFFDPARGRTIRLAAGGNLQAALDDAHPGDQILLAPGAEFRGKFFLRPKSPRNGRWITVRTDLGADSLAAGTRMTPELAAQHRLARILGTGTMPEPTITTDGPAAGWRLLELEIGVDPSIKKFGTLVRFGPNDVPTREEMPGDLVLDRSWVHGSPDLDLWRCVLLNGTSSAVTNSTVDDCHSKGIDNYAIAGITGEGPFKIVNNYLAGAGMGIFFGGGDPRIQNLSPSDFEIRHNHITRPTSWKGRWTVKNLLELKHAKRVLVEGNLFENHWVDAQGGPAIVLKSTNQSGKCPWCQTADVTFRLNILRNAPGAMTIAAKPEPREAVPAARFAIEDNLFYNIGEFEGTKNGRLIILLGPLSDVTIARNTFLHGTGGTHALLFDAAPSTNLAVTGNVFTRGTYGVWASGAGEGTAALEKAWPGTWTFRDNVVYAPAMPRASYPPTSRVLALPASLVGSMSVLSGFGAEAQLVAGLADGSPVGVDLKALGEALRGVAPEFVAPPAAAARRAR